jgi:hypothetical protein
VIRDKTDPTFFPSFPPRGGFDRKIIKSDISVKETPFPRLDAKVDRGENHSVVVNSKEWNQSVVVTTSSVFHKAGIAAAESDSTIFCRLARRSAAPKSPFASLTISLCL